jgi:hypothetical protein
MKCQKCGFDKNLYILEIGYSNGRADGGKYIAKFCSECGAKFEEENKLPWWCVPGMIIRDEGSGWEGRILTITKFSIYFYPDGENDNLIGFQFIKRYKPVSGPFAMIPEDANLIFFNIDGRGGFQEYEGHPSPVRFPIWHDCPEEFKGKTFPITEDIR